MQFFRSHIARLYGFLLLLLGVALSNIAPTQQKHNHSAFTSWLEGHLRADDEAIQHELESIARHESELEVVIRKASEVVKSHTNDFKLPVSENSADTDEQVYQLLLSQWKDYQNAGSGMGKAVRVEPLKTHILIPVDGVNLASIPSKKPHSPKLPAAFSELEENGTLAPSYLLAPFESGTAIGAP